MKLIKAHIHHERFSPKKYLFGANTFWFSFSRDEYLQNKFISSVVSFEKRSIYSFKSVDHFHWPEDRSDQSIDETLSHFLSSHGVSAEIVEWDYYGFLSTFGYLFNPVCFFIIKTSDQKKYAVIEVGNTFNELRPYFVDHGHFNGDSFSIMLDKNYYISPFLSADNKMLFKFELSNSELDIKVEDRNKNDQLELIAAFQGQVLDYSHLSLIKFTLRYPLVTLMSIFFIHWHAFILWLKKIPYYKKNDQIHLQKGMQKWK